MTYSWSKQEFEYLIPHRERKRNNIQNLESSKTEETPQLSNNPDFQSDPFCEEAAPSLITINGNNDKPQNTENSSSTPMFDKSTKAAIVQPENENEMKYTKIYFVKINLVLYIIYITITSIISIISLKPSYFDLRSSSMLLFYNRLFNAILLVMVFICGFRELCYVITMDIKNKKITRKLYTINSFLLCYFCLPCNKIEINLKDVYAFYNENYWNFKGNCLFYKTQYSYNLVAITKGGKIDLIKKCAQIEVSGLIMISCFLYHRFSGMRFNFDDLVDKLNDMLAKNRKYINQD